MKRLLTRVFAGLSALVLIVAGYAGITLLRARGSLPRWDGTVQVAGVGSPVEIVRDEDGIPFIRAASEGDLYFAQGFVHAQDRFWQMSLIRQRMAGRLAEWLGAAGLGQDRISRTYGWSHLAERSLEATPAGERMLLEAYAAGVNAWLDNPAYRRPPEMVILHVRPERWRASDVFLVAYQLHDRMVRAGLEAERLLLQISGAPPSAAAMVDQTGLEVPPIITRPPSELVRQATVPFEDGAFSNSWTISGAHTASGEPLVANDPHLALSLPGAWHLQHHELAGTSMAGATMPGLPGIVLGHNGSLAWAATNANVDVRDFAFVELHPDDPARYRRGPEEPWQDFEIRNERIGVRLARDRVETVRSTARGVIWPWNVEPLPPAGLAIEIRDLPSDLPNSVPTALLRMTRAATVADGIDALEAFTGAPQSISLADTRGSIGFVVAGRIPVRPEEHARFVDLAPADSNARTYLDYAENPRLVDPPSGRIVTANQRIIGDEYPHYLSDRWQPPHRAFRIHEMLDERETHDPDSFTAMQMDSLSPVAREIVPLLLEVEPARDADARLVNLLSTWDHRFSLDAAAPVAFLTWVEKLSRRVVLDELGALASRWGPTMYPPLVRALRGEHPEWCDDRGTGPVESCAEALSASLTEARLALEDAFGDDPAAWRWGDVARFRLPHVGLDAFPIVGGMLSGSTPLPGGPASMFANYVDVLQAPSFSGSLSNAGYQAIYDLADLDASLFMAQGGPSGHFRSPFYNNLTSRWIAGERIRLTPGAVTPVATLTLLPAEPDG